MLIKEINFRDRPRERALQYGMKTLSNSELLAILFRTGTKDISAMELGNKLLQHYSVTELMNTTAQELMTISGIGNAKALSILAGFELFKRGSTESKTKVISPNDLRNEILNRLKGLANG